MIPLTLLYAPADRPDLVRKALAGPADAVIVDLEDAVAPARKDEARANLVELLTGPTTRAVQVRVNAVGTPWHEGDMAAVAELPDTVSLRVPKVESGEAASLLCRSVPGRELHALLESPLAVERAFEIASSGVASIGLGESDLRSALHVASTDDLGWQRSRLVNAAAAAGIAMPAMSVYPHLGDPEGLRASCAAGRAAGFLGRAAIHPRQLDVIREAFLPTRAELERASAVLAGLEGAQESGAGTYVLPDGGFIDIAMLRSAQLVVDLAHDHGILG